MKKLLYTGSLLFLFGACGKSGHLPDLPSANRNSRIKPAAHAQHVQVIHFGRLEDVAVGVFREGEDLLVVQVSPDGAKRENRIPVLGSGPTIEAEDVDFDGRQDLVIRQTINAYDDVQPHVFRYDPARQGLVLSWELSLPNLEVVPEKNMLRGAVRSDPNGFFEVQVCHPGQHSAQQGRLTCARSSDTPTKGNWSCIACQWTITSDSTCHEFTVHPQQVDSLYHAWH